jgi:hypothetical protein
LIRLSTFENNSFEPFKTINQDSYDGLKKDCEILKTSYTQFVVFKYLQLNLKDYLKFIEKTSKVPMTHIDPGMLTNINNVLEVNRLVLNFLTAFKFFLDNAETYFKRKYGKESGIIKDFIKLTNNSFDSSFAYRFLSKLRHYSVHLGFPIEVLNLNIDFNKEDPEKSLCDFQLIIDIELLKKEKDLFGAKIHNELNQMNSDINLKPLIAELSHYIIEIQKYIYRIQKSEISESIENIDLFVDNHKTEKNQIKVYSDYKKNGNEISFNVYDVPYDIINEYKKTYENWH